MTNEAFSGNNYSIQANDDEQFVISHPQGTEVFDTFEELVESHPICEEARGFFCGSDQYQVMTNQQSGSQWLVFADEQGMIVGRYDDPADVRSHLCQLGLETVAMDVDGNGSFAQVPIEWIGGGEAIVGSPRALELLGSNDE